MGTIIFERNGHRYMAILSNPGVRLVYMNTGEELIAHRPGKTPAPVPAPPPDPAPVDLVPPPVDVVPPQPAPTVASITVAGGSVQVRGVSRPGTCFALISRRVTRMAGAEIEALAATSFAVPAHQTTTGSIDTANVAPGAYLHLTIRSDDGQYSIDTPQKWN